jgi:hypothetical protein
MTRRPNASGRTLSWFAAALFVSAALVFAVQPLIGRLLLPEFGGTSVVWSSCLVFFQAALLAGYAYAYVLGRWRSLAGQVAVHLVLLVAALATLPVKFGGHAPGEAGGALGWLWASLVLEVGLPFAVLSASAPLFQSWFSRLEHPDADDPYHLYAASNAGSLTALLAYPLLVEPTLTLDTQGWAWTAVYAVFVLLVARLAHLSLTAPRSPRKQEKQTRAVSFSSLFSAEHLRWALYAALPSALLVSVTAYVTTDVAAVPLLWVIPLALYLVSFIIAFSRRAILSRSTLAALAPASLVATGVVLLFDFAPSWLAVLLGPHLVAFFVLATLSHVELVARRPEASRSSAFYLTMAAGGVVGGAFSALAAPWLFDTVVEYPLLLCITAVLLLGRDERSPKAAWTAGVAGVICVGVILVVAHEIHADQAVMSVGVTLAAIVALALYGGYRRPRVFGWLFALLLLGAVAASYVYGKAVVHERSYFGHYRVSQKTVDDQTFNILYHGTTIHGFQVADGPGRREPMGYYAAHSGIGELLSRLAARPDGARVGVVGLGIGSLAAYAEQGPLEFVFLEIDPVVVDIARDERFFDYLEVCGARCEVVVGDGRVRLRQMQPASFDVLVLDAYDSDSIPMHLLTREALALYLERVRDGGVLAFHLSNRYFDLPPVVGRLCEEFSLRCLEFEHNFESDAMPDGGAAARWVFAAAEPSRLDWLADLDGAHPVSANGPLWTDDFANLWKALGAP